MSAGPPCARRFASRSQGLVRTSKGTGGGSYVTLPTIDHISESLSSSITLLADARDLTLEELIEVRVLLEVPAARLAARRRRGQRRRAAAGDDSGRHPALDTQSEFVHNRDFHATLIDVLREPPAPDRRAAGLLGAADEPLALRAWPHVFHRSIHAHHRRIVEAVDAGDEDAAAAEMRRPPRVPCAVLREGVAGRTGG